MRDQTNPIWRPRTLLRGMMFSVILSLIAPIANAQKFPSCTDSAANEKIVSLLTRFVEKSGEGNSDVRVASVEVENIFPRIARYGNYSGILECEVTALVTLMKISTGQRFVTRLNKFALRFGYDQNGDFVVETPSGMR